MRHVDDGTIHAWLDEQITDPAEAAWIEEHFGECGACRARLADERSTFDRAQALLAETAPSGERLSFEALVAKVGRNVQGSETAPVAPLTHGRVASPWLQHAGWAASIALAIGLGWTAREFTGRDTFRPDPPRAMVEPSAATAPVPMERAAAPRPLEGPIAGTDVANLSSADALRRQRTEAQSRSLNTATPAAQLQPPRQSAAAVPRPAEPETQVGSAALAGATNRSASTAETQAAPPVATVPAPVGALREEANTVAREAAARPAAADTEWRPLPRTEAAARTGMPLYGIDGLEPVLTALSADGAVVRTTYRLASGDVVELAQQRVAPDVPLGVPVGVAPVRAARRALSGAGRAGIVVDQLASAQRTWSSVRQGLRVTLLTTSDATDLSALGTKLRVD